MYCKLPRRTSEDTELSKNQRSKQKHMHTLEFRTQSTVDNYGHYTLKKRIKEMFLRKAIWKTGWLLYEGVKNMGSVYFKKVKFILEYTWFFNNLDIMNEFDKLLMDFFTKSRNNRSKMKLFRFEWNHLKRYLFHPPP